MTTASLLYVAALVAVFYILIIRPQQARQREMRAVLAALSEGDRVITAGGMHGTVVRVLDKTVVLRVLDNTEIEFEKLAIVKITEDIPAFPQDSSAEEDGLDPSDPESASDSADSE